MGSLKDCVALGFHSWQGRDYHAEGCGRGSCARAPEPEGADCAIQAILQPIGGRSAGLRNCSDRAKDFPFALDNRPSLAAPAAREKR
jgi:hypothetical protein